MGFPVATRFIPRLDDSVRIAVQRAVVTGEQSPGNHVTGYASLIRGRFGGNSDLPFLVNDAEGQGSY